MSEAKSLLPCPSPWCTKSEPELQQGGFRNGHFRVECQNCFTKGPTRDDLNGGGPAAIAAWNTRFDAYPALVEALEEFCAAAEYWAGCDEGCSHDDASSEIMRSGGAWPACAYNKARTALSLTHAPGDGQ